MHRFLLTTLILIFTFSASAGAQEPTRYEVQAAFVFKFIKYVAWPPSDTDNEILEICVAGSGEILLPLLSLDGYEVKNRIVEVVKVQRLEELNGCEILFIDIEEAEKRSGYLEYLDSKSVLTISHFDGFIDNGGMINFNLYENRVQFEINVVATKKSNIKISSKLLRLARRIIVPGQ